MYINESGSESRILGNRIQVWYKDGLIHVMLIDLFDQGILVLNDDDEFSKFDFIRNRAVII